MATCAKCGDDFDVDISLCGECVDEEEEDRCAEEHAIAHNDRCQEIVVLRVEIEKLRKQLAAMTVQRDEMQRKYLSVGGLK